MASASEVLAICNGALIELGEDLLDDSADLNSPSGTNEELCAKKFNDACRQTLRLHQWNCVAGLAELAEDEANPPAWGFERRFSLPSDFCYLTKIRLGGVWFTDLSGRYEREGDSILTDCTIVEIGYIAFPTVSHATSNNSVWNAYFGSIDSDVKRLFELKLAHLLCYPLTRKANLKRELREEFMLQEDLAVVADARESAPANLYFEDFSAARWERGGV